MFLRPMKCTRIGINIELLTTWFYKLQILNPEFQIFLTCIEIINNKARHNLIDAKCRWRSDLLDGAGSFREPLGQTKMMQIRQRETQIHQRETTHKICCLAAQLPKLGSSGYVFGVLSWPFDILIGKLAAAWPLKISSNNTSMPETITTLSSQGSLTNLVRHFHWKKNLLKEKNV